MKNAIVDATKDSVQEFVSEKRLWALLMSMAKFGETAAGGVNRQAFSSEDTAAKKAVIAWATERGYAFYQDEIANLFIRRPGTEPELPPLLLGSHLDSQPTGGKFDGAAGVAAALEVLNALDDAGITTRRAIEVVSWSNEEGSRFSPGAMGSAVFSGKRSLHDLASVSDKDGNLLRDALKQTLSEVRAPLRSFSDWRPYAYLELHIEQGPVLEQAEVPIGIVNGVQGMRRFTVEITGEEGHAGTVPMQGRKDALSSALAIVQAVEKIGNDPADVLRLTVGRFEVFPGSPNTIPGRVLFTIDLRHPSTDVLDRVGAGIAEAVAARRGTCDAELRDLSYVRPTVFPEFITEGLRLAAASCGLASLEMNSGAGHDAMHLAKVCAAGMIFIPCWRGISHNEKESATPRDVAAGAKVLAEAALKIASV